MPMTKSTRYEPTEATGRRTRGKYTFWRTLAACTRLSDAPRRPCEKQRPGHERDEREERVGHVVGGDALRRCRGPG